MLAAIIIIGAVSTMALLVLSLIAVKKPYICGFCGKKFESSEETFYHQKYSCKKGKRDECFYERK
jgi:hypothetical protein